MIDAAGPWGTGPFILKSGVSTLAKRSPEVILEPNPDYWNADRKPKVRIVFDNIISKADALKDVAKKDGKIDAVLQVTAKEAASFDGGGNARIVENDAKTTLVGVFNQNKDGSPWTDKKARQALNMAVDQAQLVKDAANGYGNVVAAFIEEGRFGHNPNVKPYAVDRAAAKKALGDAGVKSVLIKDGADAAVVAALAKQLKEVGIDVQTTKDDNWDLNMVFHFNWSPQYPVGVVHREFFGKDGGFRAQPDSAGFDAFYAKLLKTTDRGAQEKMVQDLEATIHEEADVLFMYSPHMLAAVRNGVEVPLYDTWMAELPETTKN